MLNRRVLCLFTLAVCVLACGVAARAHAADPPRVRLVTTGGTISDRSGGRLTAEELVQSIPDLPRYARAD
jgi:hypothetical protein